MGPVFDVDEVPVVAAIHELFPVSSGQKRPVTILGASGQPDKPKLE